MRSNRIQPRLSSVWLATPAVLPGIVISSIALSNVPIVLNIILVGAIYAILIILYVYTVVRFSNTIVTAVSLYILFVVVELGIFMSIVTAFA